MRTITFQEAKVISGGSQQCGSEPDISLGNLLAGSSAIGGALMLGGAQAAGLKGASLINAGAFGGIAGGGLAVSLMTGMAVGNLLNEYTPIQSWIADALDSINGFLSKMTDYTK